MDGGDVLTVARDVFVGVSSRTNAAAVGQMRALLEPFGYRVHAVSVTGCLHLKSAVTALSDDRLLLNGEWAARGQFAPFGLVDVDPLEPAAANIVRAGRELVYPDAFPADPRTHRARRVQRPRRGRLGAGQGRRRRHVLQPHLRRRAVEFAC